MAIQLAAIPIKVPVPSGDMLYRGDETFELEAGRRLRIRDQGGGAAVERFDEEVPAGKTWSVRVLLEITETSE